MGSSHPRPYISRREFLRRAGFAGAAAAAGPWFWKKLA
ncbi:MAG: twin-arginine translocation signal domain-containing protein [Actinomycetota bacterium]